MSTAAFTPGMAKNIASSSQTRDPLNARFEPLISLAGGWCWIKASSGSSYNFRSIMLLASLSPLNLEKWKAWKFSESLDKI